jgi:enoyl-CoA hydratase
VTKRVRYGRDGDEHGVRGADERVGEIAAPLFATRDLQNAVRSFLDRGPGKATFVGR